MHKRSPSYNVNLYYFMLLKILVISNFIIFKIKIIYVTFNYRKIFYELHPHNKAADVAIIGAKIITEDN